MSTENGLMALLEKNHAAPTSAKKNSKKPMGYINIEVGGVNLFSRSVWETAESETPFLNDLNELAKENPEAASKAILKLLAEHATVTISTKKSSGMSLEDLLK